MTIKTLKVKKLLNGGKYTKKLVGGGGGRNVGKTQRRETRNKTQDQKGEIAKSTREANRKEKEITHQARKRTAEANKNINPNRLKKRARNLTRTLTANTEQIKQLNEIIAIYTPNTEANGTDEDLFSRTLEDILNKKNINIKKLNLLKKEKDLLFAVKKDAELFKLIKKAINRIKSEDAGYPLATGSPTESPTESPTKSHTGSPTGSPAGYQNDAYEDMTDAFVPGAVIGSPPGPRNDAYMDMAGANGATGAETGPDGGDNPMYLVTQRQVQTQGQNGYEVPNAAVKRSGNGDYASIQHESGERNGQEGAYESINHNLRRIDTVFPNANGANGVVISNDALEISSETNTEINVVINIDSLVKCEKRKLIRGGTCTEYTFKDKDLQGKIINFLTQTNEINNIKSIYLLAFNAKKQILKIDTNIINNEKFQYITGPLQTNFNKLDLKINDYYIYYDNSNKPGQQCAISKKSRVYGIKYGGICIGGNSRPRIKNLYDPDESSNGLRPNVAYSRTYLDQAFSGTPSQDGKTQPSQTNFVKDPKGYMHLQGNRSKLTKGKDYTSLGPGTRNRTTSEVNAGTRQGDISKANEGRPLPPLPEQGRTLPSGQNQAQSQAIGVYAKPNQPVSLSEIPKALKTLKTALDKSRKGTLKRKRGSQPGKLHSDCQADGVKLKGYIDALLNINSSIIVAGVDYVVGCELANNVLGLIEKIKAVIQKLSESESDTTQKKNYKKQIEALENLILDLKFLTVDDKNYEDRLKNAKAIQDQINAISEVTPDIVDKIIKVLESKFKLKTKQSRRSSRDRRVTFANNGPHGTRTDEPIYAVPQKRTRQTKNVNVNGNFVAPQPPPRKSLRQEQSKQQSRTRNSARKGTKLGTANLNSNPIYDRAMPSPIKRTRSLPTKRTSNTSTKTTKAKAKSNTKATSI
jgi:hypothetical protein